MGLSINEVFPVVAVIWNWVPLHFVGLASSLGARQRLQQFFAAE